MSDAKNLTIGVLLAGGQSRRMFPDRPGGGDKSLRDLAGRTMIEHVAVRLAPQVGGLVINANGDPARFSALRLPVVADPIEGHPGPLAGVLAGMMWCRGHAPEASHIATVSTDAPFIPLDLVERLWAAIAGSPRRIAIARSAGTLHPVIGLWPVILAADLGQALHNGVRKVLAWTDRHGTEPVDFPFTSIGGREIDPFFNANHPEELEQARRLLEAEPN